MRRSDYILLGITIIVLATMVGSCINDKRNWELEQDRKWEEHIEKASEQYWRQHEHPSSL